MDLVSSLVSVDVNKRIGAVVDDFCQQLRHEKITTRKYCITYSARIVKERPDLAEKILTAIVDVLSETSAPASHRATLFAEFTNVLLDIATRVTIDQRVLDFLRGEADTTASKRVQAGIRKVLRECGVS